MSGWVKLFRDIEKWEWIDDPFTYWAFTRMVLMANFEDKSWQGVNIPRGSFVTSLENLAVKFRCSTSRIRELQKRLKSTSEITIKTTNKYSMITITNYEKYNSNENLQQTEQQAEQQTNRKQTANKTTTTKESKNIRTKEIRNNTQAELVIEYFNTTLKRSLSMTSSNFKEVNARLKEGHTVEQMKTLIDHVSAVWTRDPFWSGLIRPSTMFGGKFDGYLQEAVATPLNSEEALLAEAKKIFSFEEN